MTHSRTEDMNVEYTFGHGSDQDSASGVDHRVSRSSFATMSSMHQQIHGSLETVGQSSVCGKSVYARLRCSSCDSASRKHLMCSSHFYKCFLFHSKMCSASHRHTFWILTFFFLCVSLSDIVSADVTFTCLNDTSGTCDIVNHTLCSCPTFRVCINVTDYNCSSDCSLWSSCYIVNDTTVRPSSTAVYSSYGYSSDAISSLVPTEDSTHLSSESAFYTTTEPSNPSSVVSTSLRSSTTDNGTQSPETVTSTAMSSSATSLPSYTSGSTTHPPVYTTGTVSSPSASHVTTVLTSSRTENPMIGCGTGCQNNGTCMNTGTGNYSCSCTTEYTGMFCETEIPPNTPGPGGSDDGHIGLIIGLVVGLSLAIILIVGIAFFVKYAQKTRAKHGTYRPSQQEMDGSRLDFNTMFKLPPEERLI